MSTLDKINSELASLQQELSQLHHYTEEIGKAKDASTSVIKMSKDFLLSFQKRVEEINKEMAKASADFTKKCSDTSKSLEDANRTFQKGISDAKITLSDVGAELSIVAEKVNELAIKIESINILGHFEKMHGSLAEIQATQTKYYNEISRSLQEYTNEQRIYSQKNRIMLIVIIICVTIGLALGGYIALKIS
jgi:chromosome segregation ATPase